jgi:hypothetical protein
MLHRLAWTSIPSPSFSAARLNEVIASSRRNNERNHVSGMLLFTGANFLGILEGQDLDLRDLWLRLRRDQRHCDLLHIGEDMCGSRWFPVWRMGYMVDASVDALIMSFRSLQPRVGPDRACAAASVDAIRVPPASSAPKWAQVLRPIMASADSM